MELPTIRKYILGSGSPRRKLLLEGIGWPVIVRKKDVPEDIPHGLKEGEIPTRLAEEKAMAFDGELKEGELLITADTIVWQNGHVMNKPVNEEDALSMLRKLQGTTHQVFTGVCMTLNGRRHCFSVRSDVTFNALDDTAIRNYIHHYQPYDKAGSYGAQEGLPEGLNPCSEKEIRFLDQIGRPNLFQETLKSEVKAHVPIIHHIEGSYFNVMGLPIAELLDELRMFNKNN